MDNLHLYYLVMLPNLLIRPNLFLRDEAVAASQAGFKFVRLRTNVDGGPVLGRYSVMPFYNELDDDLRNLGSWLCQSRRQHAYIADLSDWSYDLREFTPKTWSRIEDIPSGHPGAFVVKGATSSRKDRWLTHMFAPDRSSLLTVYSRCLADSYIEEQGAYIRRYEPLKTFLKAVNGQPITNEWRVFVLAGHVVASGYYWATYDDETKEIRPSTLPSKALALVQKAIELIDNKAFFYTVDVAEKEDGDWIVVELNDGQQAGLSMIDPFEFYASLKDTLLLEDVQKQIQYRRDKTI